MNWEAFFAVIGLALAAFAWVASLVYTVSWLDEEWWGSPWAISLPLLAWITVPCAVIAGLTI